MGKRTYIGKRFISITSSILVSALLSVYLLIPNHISAQSSRITYSASEISLSRVLEDISKEYQVKFAFDAEAFNGIIISVKFRNEPLNSVMYNLGKKYLLDFRLLDGTWVVTRKKQDQALPPVTEKPAPLPVIVKSQVSGYVTDNVTGEPLNYCSIVFSGNKGTITNELGFFYIETLADSIRFYITHLGYQRLDTVISARLTQPVKIALKPFVMMMKEVDVIRQEKNMIEMPKYADRVGFNASQSANMPRLAHDDLINMLTLIPGIGFLPGTTGGLSIRGSNPSENLILLDGIPVLETGHMFGSVSALNAGFIRQAFVSRGGFDASFGDRASGLIELTAKSGSRSNPNAETSFNLLNGDFMGSIPFGRNFSLSGAYRRSYTDYWPNYLFKRLLSDSRLTNVTDQSVSVLPIVRYQDINLKATVYASQNNEVSLSFIRSDDQQMLDYTAGTSQHLYRNEWVRGKNTGLGLNWSFQTGKWHHLLTSGFSELSHYQELESGEELSVTTTSGSSGRGKKVGLLRRLKIDNSSRIKYEFESDSNAVREFRIQFSSEVKQGIFTHQFGAGYVDDYFHFRIWSDNSERPVPIDSLRRTANQKISHFFVQQTIEPRSKLKFRWGMRGNYDQLSGKFYLQPRGGVEFTPLADLKIYYNAGVYDQFLSKVPLIDYNKNVDLVWYLPDNSGDGVLRSVHHIAGFQWTKGGFLVNAEFYHKSVTGKQWLYAETYKIKDQSHIRYVSHDGEEQNQGFDLYAQFRHAHWNHQAGYSFSDGKERITGLNSGAWFPSLSNHRHQLQLAEMFSLNGLVASVIWNYRSGQPRILPSSNSAILNFERLDYFSQLDASLAKTFLFRHIGLTGGVSLLNILNRLNVIQVDYLRITNETSTYNITSNVSSLSFTPVFFLKCRFF